MNDLGHTGAEILIVDDEPSVVRFLTRALTSAGYENIKGFGDDPVHGVCS
jgi:DNA-binding NtrC family response regulator